MAISLENSQKSGSELCAAIDKQKTGQVPSCHLLTLLRKCAKMTRLTEKPALPRCKSCDDEEVYSSYCDLCFVQLYSAEDNYAALSVARNNEIRYRKAQHDELVAKWNAQIERDRLREQRREEEKQRRDIEKRERQLEILRRKDKDRTATLSQMERVYQVQREAKLRAELAAKKAKAEQKLQQIKLQDTQFVSILFARFGQSLFNYLTTCAEVNETGRELSHLTVAELRKLLEKVMKTGLKQ